MIDKLMKAVFGPEAFVIGTMFDIFGGLSAKRSSDKSAQKAQEIANFNAEIIERDFGFLQKQADIINANAALREARDRYNFDLLQGDTVVGFSYGGIDIAEGTPMRVMRENARNFELDMLINQRNDSIAIEQIANAQEDVMLQAELARMGGMAQASALRAQGTQSLINAVGNAFTTSYRRGMFDTAPAPVSPSLTAGQSQTRIV